MVQTVCRVRIIVRIRIFRILGLAGLKKSRKAKLFCDQYPVHPKTLKILILTIKMPNRSAPLRYSIFICSIFDIPYSFFRPERTRFTKASAIDGLAATISYNSPSFIFNCVSFGFSPSKVSLNLVLLDTTFSAPD
jgi:hypothetical protein